MVIGGLMLWAPQLVLDLLLVGFVARLVLRARNAGRTTAVRPARPVRAARAQPARRTARSVARPIERAEPVRAPARAAPREALFDQTAAAAPAAFEPEWTLTDPLFDQTAEVDLTRASRVSASAPAEPEPVIDLPAYEDDEPQIEIGGRPWEPVPVPRPTYTTKPTAPARTAKAPIFEPLLPPVETAPEVDPAAELEEILDRRWAVND
jgi:hypothetical protein